MVAIHEYLYQLNDCGFSRVARLDLAIMAELKRGDLVEFTDNWYQHYPPVDTSVIKWGVATGKGNQVETVRGIETAKHIHSYAWAGWIPDEIEPIWEKYHPELMADDWDDY